MMVERREDSIVLDRKVSVTWLMMIAFGVTGWCVSVYYNTQRNIEQLQRNMEVVSKAVDKFSDKMVEKDIKDARMETRVDAIERRSH